MSDLVRITEPGIYADITPDDYYADPCPRPSLSNSLSGDLLHRCPRSAWAMHPRLNPSYAPDDRSRFDLGSVAHKLVLGRGRDFQIIEHDSYRAKAAQEERDLARANGKIPILSEQYENAREMKIAAFSQLQHIRGAEHAFEHPDGMSEVGLFWTETIDGETIWVRNLIDKLFMSGEVWEIWDYKTTERSANPNDPGLGGHVVDFGYDTQAAFQERGLTMLYPSMGGRIRFRLVFQEVEPPHLLSVVEPDEATMFIARKKVQRAISLWAKCQKTQEYPSYPQEIVRLRHNEWKANAWLARELEESETEPVNSVTGSQGEGGSTASTVAKTLPPPPPPIKGKPGRPKGSKNKKRLPIPPHLTIISGG